MRYFAVLIATFFAIGGCASSPIPLMFEVAEVEPSAETTPMLGLGDQADDPAIWVNPLDASRSLILGTNKDSGLYVYDLSGNARQFLPVGRVNNVDLRSQLAVASNDEVGGLSWFRINPQTLNVEHLGDTPVSKAEPYGVCAGMVDGIYTTAVTYKDGSVELWSVPEDQEGTIAPTLDRVVTLSSQLEGCVFDDASATLFIGEEEYGIWSLDLAGPDSAPRLVDRVGGPSGLAMDVEGLAIWTRGNGNGYLIASAQGKDRFVVYELTPPHAPVGLFRIIDTQNGAIDGTSNTDGIDATSTPLPGYSEGLLVVQDDANPTKSLNQNFKLVDWGSVMKATGLQKED